MEKIKDILSPGHKQDADLLYGSQQSATSGNTGKLSGEGSHFAHARDAAQAQSSVGATKGHQRNDTMDPDTITSTTPASKAPAERNSGSVGKAVNPEGSKYDEGHHGTRDSATAATTTLPDRATGTFHPDPVAERDTGLHRQTANPRETKSDETRYGTTIAIEPTPTRVSKGGALEPVGGVSHSSDHGQGIIGAQPSSVGPDTTSRPATHSGPGAAAAAAGTAAVLGTGTERSFPLSGGSTKDSSGTGPAVATREAPATTGHAADRTTGGQESKNHDTGLAAAAASTAFASHEHGGHGHRYDGPNTDSARSGPTFTSGPHATELGNRLDPNNPKSVGSSAEVSSIPSPLKAAGAAHERTSYDDQKATPPQTSGISMPGAYPDSAAATPAYEEPRNANVSSGEHHYGRDAAIAGAGAGAAAAGGLYEARRKGSTGTDPASSTHGPHKSNIANIMDPRVLPDPSKMKGHQARSTETDPASKTVGPHSSNIANIADPRVLPQPEKMKQHTTAGPHQSDTLNRVDPRVDSDLSKETNQHHYGRDAAVAGGLGAGAAGAYAASQHQGEKNPYSSHAVDPRVHGSSTSSDVPSRTSSTKGGWFAGPAGSAVDSNKGTPATSNKTVGPAGLESSGSTQTGQQHHYGRDAAVAGGVGLAGAGAGYAYKQHEAARDAERRPHGTTESAVPSSAQAPTALTSTSQPTAPRAADGQQPTSQHHYGRDAAIAGGGGLAGAGLANQYGERKAEKAAEDYSSGNNSAAVPTVSSATQPPHSNTSTAQPAVSSSTTQPTGQHHYGRDAAVAGGAGLVGSGAAYEHQKREAEKAEREQPHGTIASATGPVSSQTKTTADPTKTADGSEKHHYGRDAAAAGAIGAAGAGAYEYSKHDVEKAEKERLKEEKKHQKEAEKEEKKHQKEVEKEEKKHHKEAEKEEKKQQKELEKEQKKHEKEVEKEEKKKHGGGLLGFLHRDKDKDKEKEEEKAAEPATTADKHHRAEEAAGAAGVAGAGAAAYEHHENGKHDRNRLHKDPPPEYIHAHGDEHYGTDGRIGEAGAASGPESTRAGEHSAIQPGEKEGIVIEPHTGLPMNVGKYGTGAGGTDGNQTIHGLHSHGAESEVSGSNISS